ncbi:D-inositol-3-phosphate glycosyltransferase [subsurface metagenome]
MKICLVNSHPKATGFGNYAFEIYNQLRDKCKIDHIFLNFRERKIEKIVGSSRERIARSVKFPLDHPYFFYYRAQKRIPQYNLYFIANQNLSFLKLKPKIVFCHDIIHCIYPRSKKYWLLGRLLYSGLGNAEFIIAASKSTKRDLVRFYSIPEEKISVVYEGVNHKKFRPENSNSSNIYQKYKLSPMHRYVFHISSETPRKNVDGLVKAFYQLKTKYKLTHLKLLKAGNPEYQEDRKRLLNLIKQLGLQEEIIFLDYVPGEDLPALYNIAELFVFPSFYEGFGLSPLEAMACGTPVITSSASSLPEVVGDAGIIVNPKDIESLSQAMHEVLVNEELRKKMIGEGLRRATLFSWKVAGEETLKVCKDLYGRGND